MILKRVDKKQMYLYNTKIQRDTNVSTATERGVHRMKNTNQMYLSAQEVANILGMSESYAYTVIRKMNDELKARGCITIAGKIPTKYFEEKFFGVQVIQ